jgi:hypothetical protein
MDATHETAADTPPYPLRGLDGCNQRDKIAFDLDAAATV